MVNRKMIGNQKGFTLIELMTVLIILGVILGIGIPRYLQIQAKAEWDADASTIENIAKAAEVYAAQKNAYAGVNLNADLIDNDLVDGAIVLNRIAGEGDKSVKNSDDDDLDKLTTTNDPKFTFDDAGRVNNLDAVIEALLGPSPY